jgi:hypothetical protein
MMPPAAEDPQHNDCNDPDIACDSPLARSTTIESTTYIRRRTIKSCVTMLLDTNELKSLIKSEARQVESLQRQAKTTSS